MKRAVLLCGVLVLVSLSLLSCYNGSYMKKPPSGATTRVMASQGTTAGFVIGGLFIVNVNANDQDGNDILARAGEISAGSAPGLMVIDSTRDRVLTFDSGTNSVEVINTTNETNIGSIRLAGPTTSLAIPTSQLAFAAVPTVPITGYAQGAVQVLNLAIGGIPVSIGVPNAQTVISNNTGTQLLVFSPFSTPSVSNSIYVLSPLAAIGPIDPGCNNLAVSTACTVVPGFDQPVYAIVNGSTAYVFNCGAECGGTQASISLLDLNSLTITATIPVNGATYGLLSGSNLYVVGNGTPTGQLCSSIPSAGSTAATYCGTLDIVDLGSMTDPYFNNPGAEIAIPDGYHDRIDLNQASGQLFIGSHQCQNIGNVANPGGEIRGCLAIYNPAKSTTSVLIPPDNGDVTGLQGFTSINQEFVAQDGNLRVYDTNIDQLLINSTLTTGTIGVGGKMIDVKAVDFF